MCAGLGQLQSPRFADEDGVAEMLFEKLDLIADGGLRHAEFFRRTGEILQAGDSLEDPQGIQWKLARQFHLVCFQR
ncbi:hypothetical protein D3C73_963060 [compost metagenome]